MATTYSMLVKGLQRCVRELRHNSTQGRGFERRVRVTRNVAYRMQIATGHVLSDDGEVRYLKTGAHEEHNIRVPEVAAGA